MVDLLGQDWENYQCFDVERLRNSTKLLTIWPEIMWNAKLVGKWGVERGSSESRLSTLPLRTPLRNGASLLFIHSIMLGWWTGGLYLCGKGERGVEVNMCSTLPFRTPLRNSTSLLSVSAMSAIAGFNSSISTVCLSVWLWITYN